MRKSILRSTKLTLTIDQTNPNGLVLLKGDNDVGRKYTPRGAYDLLQGLKKSNKPYLTTPEAQRIIDNYEQTQIQKRSSMQQLERIASQ